MKQRLFCILLAGLLVLLFVGCKNTNPTAPAPDASDTTEDQVPTIDDSDTTQDQMPNTDVLGETPNQAPSTEQDSQFVPEGYVLDEQDTYWKIWKSAPNAEFGICYQLLNDVGEVILTHTLGQYERDLIIDERIPGLYAISNGSFEGIISYRFYRVSTGEVSRIFPNTVAHHKDTVAYVQEQNGVRTLMIDSIFDTPLAPISYPLNFTTKILNATFSEDMQSLQFVSETEPYAYTTWNLHTLTFESGTVSSHHIGTYEVSFDSYESVLNLCRFLCGLDPYDYLLFLSGFKIESENDYLDLLDICDAILSESKYKRTDLEFCLTDLNKDGTDELIVRKSGVSRVNLVFSQKDGHVILLTSASGSSYCEISSEGYLLCGESNTTDSYRYSIYRINEGGDRLVLLERGGKEGSIDIQSDSPYYRIENEGKIYMTEDEYAAWQAKSPYADIEYDIYNLSFQPIWDENTPRPLPYDMHQYAKG